MKHFTESQLDEARRRAPPRVHAAFEGRGHILRPVPGGYSTRCPLHEDRSPSFSLRADCSFYCYGCGAHGDSLDLVSRLAGVSFPQAVNSLLGETGPLPVAPPAPAAAKPERLEPAQAQAWYRFLKPPSQVTPWYREATNYLTRRGINWEGAAGRELRIVPPASVAKLPAWAAHASSNTYRIAVPLFNECGTLVSVQVRSILGGSAVKTMNLRGGMTGVFANATARRALEERQAARLVIVEGLTDFLSAADVLDGDGTAVIGVVAGSDRVLSKAKLACPDMVIAVDTDEAGERYAADLAKIWPHARRLRLPQLPGAEDRSDIADHLKHDRAALRSMLLRGSP